VGVSRGMTELICCLIIATLSKRAWSARAIHYCGHTASRLQRLGMQTNGGGREQIVARVKAEN